MLQFSSSAFVLALPLPSPTASRTRLRGARVGTTPGTATKPLLPLRYGCRDIPLKMGMDSPPKGSSNETYDYVIVGGGAGGCVLANRLSEDPTKKVLLLEAGKESTKFTENVPLGFPYLLGSEIDWAYLTLPEPTLNNRRLYIPRGRVLGGSHAISVMLYHRGSAYDYDEFWPEDWSSEDVLPYFLKSEKQTSKRFMNSASHGSNGYLSVSDLSCINPMTKAFVNAATSLPDIENNDDFNDWNSRQDGVGYFQVTQKSGVRETPATAYLEPVRRRRNLTIRSGVVVERINFANASSSKLPVAEGVTYVDNSNVRHTVEAKGEVILSAGVYATPQLLMLSGIGNGEEINKYGIEVIAENTQVGDNLQDHAAVMLSYESKKPYQDKSNSSTYYTERTGKSPLTILNYLLRGKGPLTSPMCEAGGFVRTSDLPAPDLQLRFIPFVSEPNPYESLSDFSSKGDYLRNSAERPAGFTLQSVVARPKSRGKVSLVSADIRDRIAIGTNWMADESDMKTLVEGLKLSRKVALTEEFAEYRGIEKYPGDGKVSDADLEDYIRDTCHTANAMVGTCRMGDDDESVVDSELRVRGVDRLRVVDSSVMPTLPGGQSGAPTMMIAEYAADLLKQAV